MTIQITGKNVEVGDAYQAYVSDKIRALLQKYVSRDLNGHVRLEKERGLFRTNCSVRLASGLLLEAHGEGGDAYLSADAAVDRLETRVRKYKKRLKNHDASRANAARTGGFDARDAIVSVAEDDAGGTPSVSDDHPLIIAESHRNVLELSVSEAVMQLDLTEAPFLIFRNAGSGGVNLVYRRQDGHIGWIDADVPKKMVSGEVASTR
ncbi:MAG TPA: ribosome-associated translation inhibitor RaiA [Hyphomicrobium sp.]|nr:ribosome-associated translation inhibitor RaiA [Hyphomicrobium sp.]